MKPGQPVTAAQIRRACGIRQKTIARALGISQAHVSFMERDLVRTASPEWAAYRRVIAGMARHLEITENEENPQLCATD